MALTLNGSTGISGIAGSAGTPALQGNNDTNTGYFFAADTLGLSTAGSERLRITAAGNLALGNDGSFPIYTDTNDRNFILGTGSDDAAIQLHSGTDKYGGLYFGDATSGGDRYRGYVEFKHGTNDDYLRFAAGGSERLRITSVGQLVIGATTSRAKFEVKDNGYTATSVIARLSADDASPYPLVIANDTCSGNATQGMQFFVNNGGDHYIRCRGHSTAGNNNFLLLAQNDMRFSSGSSETERLRITSGGQVNIGDDFTQTTYKTQIETTNGNVLRLVTDSDDANGVELVLRKDSASPADEDNIGNIYFQGNDDGGNATFYSSIEAFSDDVSNTSENGYIRFRTRNNGSMGERLRIKSDGETNIGTGSVNIAKFCQSGNKHQIVGQAADNVAALDVYSQHGSSAAKISFAVSDNRTGSKKDTFFVRGDGSLILDTTNNGYGGLKIYDDSDGDYNVRYVAGRNQSATSHVFMRSGRTQNQSPWADATPAEHARITRGGIAFGGDTAEVNTLQKYEEGTWTPVPDNVNNTPTYHNQTGIYTRIGNLVTVVGFLQFNNAPTFDSNTAELRVSGLPFTANGAGYEATVGSVTYQSLNWSGSTYNDYAADGNLVCGAVDSTKTVFKVNPSGNNQIRGTLRRKAFEGGGIITWEMTYKTNA